jgi:hypothetical protein
VTDLHAREGEPGDGEELVVELVEEERVVGVVYFDDGAFAEFYPDEDGEPWAFDVGDLQRVLDTAVAMVDPEAPFVLEGPSRTDRGDHPVDTLAERFDGAAAFRGEEDEGFYPLATVASITGICNQLDLAVVSLEGMTLDTDGVSPKWGHSIDIGEAHAGEAWPVFRAGCNVQAEAVLERWATADSSFVIAVEVTDRDGERFVL